MNSFRRLLVLVTVVGLVTVPAEAQLPPVNLGFTSFVDGAPPAGPGFYFQQYTQLWRSSNFVDHGGDPSFPPTADEQLNALINISQFIYQAPQKTPLGGAHLGLNVMVPIVWLDLGYGIADPTGFPVANDAGLGDILVGPFLQWDPIMGERGPVFAHRIELSVIVPTGKYAADRELNPGSNFVSFNPYWAATAWLSPKLTASWRLHYLWNAKNTDPNRALAALGVGDVQAGQAFHANFATSYEVLPRQLRFGVNAFFLKQFTETKIDGVAAANTKETAISVGPGLLYSFSQNDHLFANVYFEAGVRNRPQGQRFQLRWVHHF